MKLPSLLLAILAAFVSSIYAEVSPIQMSVDEHSKMESNDNMHHDNTQTRSLKIHLDNNSSDSFDGLEVKYWFVGRDEATHEQKVVKQGERKSSLTARGKALVESEVVTNHYVEEHVTVSGSSKGRKKTTHVPASGAKISGYAVRVMKNGKVLAETYSEPSYKDFIK
jgi:hypothetical protein